MTAHFDQVERFSLTAAATGRSYEISIARPPLPARGEAPADYPVIFVADPAISFGTAVDVVAYQSGLGGGEPALVVGVGYEGALQGMMGNRTFDLTPQRDDNLPPVMAGLVGGEQGGADAFLDFLTGELADEVRRRVPEASPTRRMLFGHSLGGLLALHALMTRPGDFEAFLSSSASIWWSDFALLKLREGLDERIAAAGAEPKVFIAMGALEQTPFPVAPPGWDLEELNAQLARCRMVDAAAEMAESLRSAPLKALEHVVFDNETHVTVAPAAISRAFRFALGRAA